MEVKDVGGGKVFVTLGWHSERDKLKTKLTFISWNNKTKTKEDSLTLFLSYTSTLWIQTHILLTIYRQGKKIKLKHSNLQPLHLFYYLLPTTLWLQVNFFGSKYSTVTPRNFLSFVKIIFQQELQGVSVAMGQWWCDLGVLAVKGL